jgi:mono/diheme cytochrome c family protein
VEEKRNINEASFGSGSFGSGKRFARYLRAAMVFSSFVSIAATPAYSQQTPKPPAPSPAQSKPGADLPDGPGKDVVVRVCGKCHSPNLVLANGHTREGWEDQITKMVGFGAVGTDEDFTDILEYLVKNMPPHAAASPGTSTAATSPAASTTAAAPSKSDPADRGKITFTEKCSLCHSADTTEKKIGPGLKGFYARGTFTSDGSKVTDDSLLKLLQTGKGMMPPFKDTLEPAKLQDIIAYLKTL